MTPSRLLFLLSVLRNRVLNHVSAQSVCSQEGVARCSETGQVCSLGQLKNNVPEEECGACLEMFVEIQETGCISVESADDIHLFLESYDPLYRDIAVSPEERSQILRVNLEFISNHNSRWPRPSYQLAVNKFAADTPEEVTQRLGYKPVNNSIDVLRQIESDYDQLPYKSDFLPSRVNWVTAGAVTSVKDQGRCGCSWATSVCGAVEGSAAITTNLTYLDSMSFQQIISCSIANNGCDGGNTAFALAYATLTQVGGLVALDDYSFSDEKGSTTEGCKLAAGQEIAVSVPGALVVTSMSLDWMTFEMRVTRMKRAVSKQPVSITMRAGCATMSSYDSGILTEDEGCACSNSTCIDHAVLLVGYNDAHETPYWLIKNSWGADWGEDGYFSVSQASPTGDTTSGSWGLFGILSEGLIPDGASNAMEKVHDEPPTDADDEDDISFDAWVAVYVGCFFIFLGFLALIIVNPLTKRNGEANSK